jgi:hypothetical protein
VIAAVLVVPTDGDPGGLLTPGPCGAVMPWAGLVGDRWLAQGCRDYTDCRGGGCGCRPMEVALVLGWGGEVVPEGQDRAARALAERNGRDAGRGACWYYSGGGWSLATATGPGDHFPLRVRDGAPKAPLVDAWALAVFVVSHGLASRLVLLDAEGREVAGG